MTDVYIILLNWNGWNDTVQCLESLFRSDYPKLRVIVCDNRSTDGSLEKIKEWAKGKLTIDEKLNETLYPLVFPAIEKPLAYIEYDREQAEQGGDPDDDRIPLVLIQNGSNKGYSAGNNVGIRYALKKKAAYIWLLNNDTLAAGNTLKELVERMQSGDKTGLVGAAIYLADQPSKIQTFGGGRIVPVLGVDRFVYSPGSIHYVSGTSLFMKREVVEQTGLLDEEFFFYWEDVDYSRRAIKKGWKLETAKNAVVYHKFSASVEGQSLKSDLFKAASLVRYFRKHYKPGWVIPVSFNISGMIVNRLIRGQFNRILPIIRAIFKKKSGAFMDG